MNRWILACLATTLACLPALVPAASAQDRGSGVVRCESQNNRERVCSTGWRNARLVRQLSGSPCQEGRSWGSRNGTIWVNSGCLAEFV
ncbi:MAG: hypothetical protein GAK31_01984 [Stenotrophomonas maltophilia]|uniref:DUF3011 domain-containing protein n=1 Tax=Stenotrophomonas maltophilia TaxID=40324 RepID=A0A7V8FFE2_STEMA|nr:MAG: hypothetical protein GAK31_01984 [Stenotrophomonas maltophilia]